MDCSLPGTSVHGDSPGKTASDLLHSVDIATVTTVAVSLLFFKEETGDGETSYERPYRGGERKRGFRMLLRYKHVERGLATWGMRLKTGKGGQK